MTRILLDQGLPRTTVLHLAKAGWDVTHVSYIGISQATDREILDFAKIKNQIVITLDADFHALLAVANDRRLLLFVFAKKVWVVRNFLPY